MNQEIKFCTTADGVRLAYAKTGSGPPLVRAAHWLSHLDFDLKSDVWRHWIEGLSAANTLLRYDERGCGLSDWDVDEFSLDAWVRDLEAVVDEVELDRFPLLGLSQGGPVAVAYAVRHPDRVSDLILYGTYGQGWARRDLPESALEENEALITLTRQGWGRESPAYRQLFAGLFVPDATESQLRAFNELQRWTTSSENAARFLRAFGELDVSEQLGEVRVPTLVLHAHGDARCPFEEGRRVAAAIPHSRFVQLESENHILQRDEPAWSQFLSEVHSFIGVQAAVTVHAATPSVAGRALRTRFRSLRIVRWAVPYVAGSGMILQGVELLREPWAINAALIRGLQVLLLVGLIVIVAFASARDIGDRRSP